jgi:hypothetical protein
VRLVWEPVRSVPGDRRDPLSHVVVTAAAANGDEVFRGQLPASPGDGRATAAAGPQQAVFDAPPGRLDVRLAVQGDGGRTLDEEVVSVEVPDLTVPEVRVSTPRVHRGRTARDIQAVMADADAIPVAAREFSRTERLLIRFDVQAPGGAAIDPTAALLNRTGQKIVDLPVSPVTAGGTHQIDLGLGSVPAGEYLVEITAAADGSEVKELVAFRIGT